MVHIKSGELCERCVFGVDQCVKRRDEDGLRCEGCEMRRDVSVVQEGQRKAESTVCAGGRPQIAATGADIPLTVGCMCDDIADGIPCEFFRECDDG